MKNFLYLAALLLIIGLSSCGGNEPTPEGNARLSLKGITFHELYAAERLTGKIVTKSYTGTDTSSSLIVHTQTESFNINAPLNFNQFYDYNLPGNIKRITFDISFSISGATAERLSIDDINFTYKGTSLHSQTNIEFIDGGDYFHLPLIEINF